MGVDKRVDEGAVAAPPGEDGGSPLERSDLEQATLGDPDFERELLGEFLDGSPRFLASLKGALAARDLPALHRAAHSLKGCSWTIGARPLGRACERLEAEARDGALDRAQAQLERIRDRLAEVERYVRRTWSL